MPKTKRPDGVRTWIEVDTKALRNNYDTFRGLIEPKCRLLAVCKSNAYGHGLVDYARTMVGFGADFLGVDSMTEALRLRQDGIKIPILVLGYTVPEMYGEAIKNKISLTISSFDQLSLIKKLPTTDYRLLTHIKIDTGMHRHGFQISEIEKAVSELRKIKNIEIEGVFTHFAAAKNPAFPAETKKQIELFKQAVGIIEAAGYKPICHAAATAGTIIFPESHFDMVRIGIGLMGFWPSLETKACFEDKLKLIPALAWKSIVAEVKEIGTGEGVSYDFTEKVDVKTKIAVVPIGYWHGFRRNLSGIGRVLINGQRAKILGRVTMDIIMVDVTDIKAQVGDIVTLIGKDGVKEISVYEMASLSDTSWYETITQLNPLIKKIYI